MDETLSPSHACPKVVPVKPATEARNHSPKPKMSQRQGVVTEARLQERNVGAVQITRTEQALVLGLSSVKSKYWKRPSSKRLSSASHCRIVPTEKRRYDGIEPRYAYCTNPFSNRAVQIGHGLLPIEEQISANIVLLSKALRPRDV